MICHQLSLLIALKNQTKNSFLLHFLVYICLHVLAGGLQLIVRKDGTTMLSSIPGGDSNNALITINS